MSTINETIERYESACRDLGRDANQYILDVLFLEKKESIVAETKNEPRESMHLYLAGNNELMTKERLNDDDAEALYHALKTNLYVTSIDLRYNNITDKGAEHIGKLIEETVGLRDINLMCNDFEEEGAKHLAKALHKNQTVQSLRLNGNKMGNKGGMYFAQALQINTTLRSLDLGDSDLRIEALIALATVLRHNRTLEALNVNRPILFTHQEETTVHFALMLKENTTLRELHLMKYDMRDFGITRLCENLMNNYHLTYLNLSCNRLTRDGAKELARLLRNDTGLQVLDLGYNRLSDDGAMHLADALATYNTTLTTLVLVHNEIMGRGLCAIADAMKINTSLTNVYIWGNAIEESACIAFGNLVDSGRLELANTDVEPFVVDGVTYVSELTHGIRTNYYWGPSCGEGAVPELAKISHMNVAA